MKSELLSKQFSSVFTDENPNNIPPVGLDPKPSIGTIIITIPGVIKQLQSLKPHKASGPDEIPPWFLKEYAMEIGAMLAAIFKPPSIVDVYHLNGNMLMCVVCIRMVLNQIPQITDLFH